MTRERLSEILDAICCAVLWVILFAAAWALAAVLEPR